MNTSAFIHALCVRMVERVRDDAQIPPLVVYRVASGVAIFSWVMTAVSTLALYFRPFPHEYSLFPLVFLIHALSWGALAKAAKSLMK